MRILKRGLPPSYIINLFRTQKLFSTLSGYTGSNVQERPKDAEKDAQLTLRELEQLVVRFLVDKYNQSIDARIGDQTRYQRWEAGLRGQPEVIFRAYRRFGKLAGEEFKKTVAIWEEKVLQEVAREYS